MKGSAKTRCKCRGIWNCGKCKGTGWRARSTPFKKRNAKRFKNSTLPPEERERDHHLWRTYGISLAEFKQRLADQGNVCACCGTKTPDARGWFVDHIRSPGERENSYRTVGKFGPAQIRGIVCGRCNAAAGLIEAVGVDVVLKFIKWSCPQCSEKPSIQLKPQNCADTAMRKYRVRWAEDPDTHCKDIAAASPQHAAEVFVETSEREMSNSDEFDVVTIDGTKRHNIIVRVRLEFHFAARKPRNLQKEKW